MTNNFPIPTHECNVFIGGLLFSAESQLFIYLFYTPRLTETPLEIIFKTLKGICCAD